MREYHYRENASDDRSRLGTIRLFLWGSVALFGLLAWYSLTEASFSNTRFNEILEWAAIVGLVILVIACYSLSAHMGIESLRRKTVFVLTEQELVRKMAGWPDLRIERAKIRTIYEGKSGLVVESAAPVRRIAIPVGLSGYSTLRADIIAGQSVLPLPQRSSFTWLLAATNLIVYLSCWGLVVFSRVHKTRVSAASAAMLLLIWSSLQFIKKLPKGPRRSILLAIFVGGWIISLVTFYFIIVGR